MRAGGVKGCVRMAHVEREILGLGDGEWERAMLEGSLDTVG